MSRMFTDFSIHAHEHTPVIRARNVSPRDFFTIDLKFQSPSLPFDTVEICLLIDDRQSIRDKWADDLEKLAACIREGHAVTLNDPDEEEEAA